MTQGWGAGKRERDDDGALASGRLASPAIAPDATRYGRYIEHLVCYFH